MHNTLLSLLALLTAAVGAVSVTRRLGLPPMLGYLSVGIVFGPYGLGLLAETEQIDNVAEFGVVFLMFSIGLEFSLTRLKAMRKLVFGLGSAQMLLTTLGTMAVTLLLHGQNWRTSLAVGLAVSMSSTAIVARMLSERFELHSRSGRQTMGVLLFQDLAVVPCLILLPALAEPADDLLRTLGVALLQAVVVLALLIWLGKRLMQPLFDAVAHHKSDELFVLTTLWIVVGLAYATGRTGLSLALGAFVGGMLISETAYRHQVEADIRPFRDILLGLFFVTVGMMLDLQFVIAHVHLLMLTVAMLVIGKGLAMGVVSMVARSPREVTLRTAAQMAQAGEFGLVLMELAGNNHLVSTSVFQVTVAAMLISMFIAPVLIGQAASLGTHLSKRKNRHTEKVVQQVAARGQELTGHVIICGYGRTGERIAEFLDGEEIPFLALDVDPQRIRQATELGRRVVFGNADRAEILKAAGIDRARVVVITYPTLQSIEQVLRVVRQSRPDIPVVVRTQDESAVARLKAAGATEVIPEVLEGSLMIAAETLSQLGVPTERAIMRVREIRAARYASLREFYKEEREGMLQKGLAKIRRKRQAEEPS
ncbi:MAG TPA: monovalent cation:proton antiporter-2 (CPA2) family protein [Rhodocyclaceae bacterium]|nr:monovalent cation:proton antiporter-2 (CPA2) family protein [Rhodocyclaceae bacterium]